VIEFNFFHAAGQRMADFFEARSPIFISHAWGDGTAKFVSHLKMEIEEQTLFNVWVDMLGINQVGTLMLEPHARIDCICLIY
jgi:hypothetical protein